MVKQLRRDSAVSMPGTLQDAELLLAQRNWRKAEQVCERLLSQAELPDAAHLLGRIYRESGQKSRSLSWFRKAVEWDPHTATYHFDLADLLQSTGEIKAAAESWLAGIEIDATELRPHLSLSNALLDLGLSDAAVIAAQHALETDAGSSAAYHQLGKAWERAGNVAEAAAAYRHSVALQPDSAESLRNLAALERAAGHPETSRNLLDRAVAIHPRNPGYRFELALVLSELEDRGGAIAQLREAIRLQKQFPEALVNLGSLLRAEQCFSEAEACYKRACSQNPNYSLAWNNLANLYVELCRLQDAERCYSKAVAINPDYAEAHTGRAMLLLLSGRFEAGWAEYEWRWRKPGLQPRVLKRPAWDGEPLAGRTILVHAEQGAGDTLQFVRYARALKQQGARVLLHCPSALRSLVSTMPELDGVFCSQEPVSEFDVHAPMMSLPRLFRTRLESIPAEVPYLQAPSGMQIPSALSMARGLKVGLVWSGNPNHPNDRNRSIPTELWRKLVAIPGASFFSLQVGATSSPDTWPDQFADRVTDLAPHLKDYAATAACLQNLDLLITVDTSVAHLAGALARPVWMLLPCCNDWRWLLDRADSPWYPTMRIFRQRELGNWAGPLDEVADALQILVDSAKPSESLPSTILPAIAI